MMKRLFVRAALTALLMLGGAQAALAQSNDEVFPQFQFNFSTPGARANAMGGTFIGIADDASASITNPAGLSRLTRKQVYFEFKATSLEVDRLAAVDSLFTLQPDTFSQTTASPAFISFSMPVNEHVAVAFTRHEFLNFQEDFLLEPRPIPRTTSVFFPVDGSSDFKAVSYAGSVSFIVNPQFRVGVTISRDTLSAEAEATRTAFRRLESSPDNPDFSDQFALVRTSDIVNRTSIDDSASGTSMVFGALILPSENVSIGIQFSKGATFEVDEDLTTGAAGNPVDGFPKTVTINVPDRFGIGVSARPTPRLLVAADLVRIGYSSLAKDFTLIFNAAELTPANFEVDNVVELHAGAEYLLVPGERRLFVRAGIFSSPNHATRYLPAADPGVNASQEAKYNLLPRDTDMVGTIGAGVAVGLRFQVDAAYVVGREFVASAGVRF